MLTASSALRKDKTTTTTLQHRHFAFIAGVIANMPKHEKDVVGLRHWAACQFADACEASNPRFDRSRFMRACGLED